MLPCAGAGGGPPATIRKWMSMLEPLSINLKTNKSTVRVKMTNNKDACKTFLYQEGIRCGAHSMWIHVLSKSMGQTNHNMLHTASRDRTPYAPLVTRFSHLTWPPLLFDVLPDKKNCHILDNYYISRISYSLFLITYTLLSSIQYSVLIPYWLLTTDYVLIVPSFLLLNMYYLELITHC